MFEVEFNDVEFTAIKLYANQTTTIKIKNDSHIKNLVKKKISAI
jgi:hypothetical protein